jgi:quercetin dioxygenase-like cupin family protein
MMMTMQQPMAISGRRVVTGINAAGQSFIVSDAPTPAQFSETVPAWGGTWSSAEMFRDDPAASTSLEAVDPVQSAVTIEPPLGGSLIRLYTFGVGVGTEGRLGWHTTQSIDYGVVLSGELELHVEEQAAPTRLKPGDVTIMRANNHAWVNPGTVPCTVAFVLISRQFPERSRRQV